MEIEGTSNETMLRELCAMLDGVVPYDDELPKTLNIEHFKLWKRKAESKAYDHNRSKDHPFNFDRLTDLLIRAGYITENDDCVAFSHWISGNVMLFNEQPSERVLGWYTFAEDIYRQNNNLIDIARMRVGVVGMLNQLGQYRMAMEKGAWAELVLRASADQGDLPDYIRLAHLFFNLSVSHQRVSEYRESVEYSRRNISIWESISLAHPDKASQAELEIGQTKNSLGRVLTQFGQYMEAIRTFSEARELVVRHLDQDDGPETLARIDMNAFRVEVIRQNRLEVIRSALERAQRSRQPFDGMGNERHFALLDCYEAEWRLGAGLWQELDINRLKRVQNSCRQANLVEETWYAELLLGQIEWHHNDFDKAIEYLSNAANGAIASGFVDIAYTATDWLGRTHAHPHIDDIAKAEHYFRDAIHLIETTEKRAKDDILRAGFLDNRLAAYHDLAQLSIDRGNYEAAFEIIEHAKSRTLAEMLHSRASKGPKASDIHAIAHPQSLFVTPIEQIAQRLEKEILAISYAAIHGEIWAFVINDTGLVGKQPIHLGQSFSEDELQSGLLKIDLVRGKDIGRIAPSIDLYLRRAQEPLADWYQRLFGQLQAKLPDLDWSRYRQLLISPDAFLHSIPFACLFNEESSEYLVESFELVLIPSLSSWHSLVIENLPSLSESTALVIGYSRDNDLRSVIEEARQVADMFRSSVLLQEKGAVLDVVLPTLNFVDVALFTTHGRYRNDAPLLSEIELFGKPLTAEDVLGRTMKAQVVVLNACESDRGLMTGNEMMGLVRSFLYVGSKSVVATQWRVEDDSAAELVKQMMAHLVAGKLLAHALKLAQNEFIKKKDDASAQQRVLSHPYFWSALSVKGSDVSITVERTRD